MKNILTFEDFINESYNNDTELDIHDKEMIEALRELYSMNLSENLTNEEIENMFEILGNLDEESINTLFEDDAKDIQDAVDKREQTGKGDKGIVKKVASVLGWVFFTPYKAAYELIKIYQKKQAVKKMIGKLPDGPKKDGLRDQLDGMTRDQVRATAQIKLAQSMKSAAKTDESTEDKFSFYLNLAEKAMSADEKEKEIEKAKDEGEAKGKGLADKAKEIGNKLKDAGADKKKEVLDKLKSKAEANKKEWEKVKAKAKAVGVAL
jgi:hypothetical protein